MSNYLHAQISTVEDAEFHQMIDELYHCAGWQRDDQVSPTVWLLLSVITTQDPKAMTQQHLPTRGVLTTQVDKLPHDSAVKMLCLELVKLKHTHIESFDGKTVLTLIKQCGPQPAKRRARKPTKNQLQHQASTRIIRQRRLNRDL